MPHLAPFRRRSLICYLSAVGATVLLGCAATEVTEVEYIAGTEMRPEPGGPSGIVFGSIGSGGNDKHIAYRRIEIPFAGKTMRSGIAFAGYDTHNLGGIYIPKRDFDFQLPGIQGAGNATVFVYRLKPGEYEISGVGITTKLDVGPFFREGRFAPVGYRFTVEANRSVYLGEFLTLVSKAPPGNTYILLTDRLSRDVEVANARGAGVNLEALANVVPSVVQGGFVGIKSSVQ